MIPQHHPDIAALLQDAASWQPDQPAPPNLEEMALERLRARPAPRSRQRWWVFPSLALAPSLAGALALGLWWGSRPDALPAAVAPGPEPGATGAVLVEASTPVDPPIEIAPPGPAPGAASVEPPPVLRLAGDAAPSRPAPVRRAARSRPASSPAGLWAEETLIRPVTIIRQPGLIVVGDGSGELVGYGPAYLEHAIVGRPDEGRPETYSSVIPIRAH